tara:strand:- start:42 stop:308 length:267 start_codon:yes stop_codon:yes gene_type:complete
MSITIFIIGALIFISYLVGLITMITKANRSQEKDMLEDKELMAYREKLRREADFVDYDGMGDQGRFPNMQEKKIKKRSWYIKKQLENK